MKSFSDLSNIIPVLAERDASAGDFIVAEEGRGFATADAAAGDIVEIETGGIFYLEIATDQDVSVGDPIFFLNGGFSSSGDTIIGRAFDPATTENGVAYIAVRLGD